GGAAQVGDVERLGVGALDAGDDEVEAAADLRTVLAVARRVAAAEQGEGGDAGVGEVGRVLDVGTFDAATLGVHAPAAALAPAAAGVLLLDEVGEAFVDGVAKGFGCHGQSTSRREGEGSSSRTGRPRRRIYPLYRRGKGGRLLPAGGGLDSPAMAVPDCCGTSTRL